jgi:hypothetical protein
MEIEKFIRILKGHVLGFERSTAESIFQSIRSNAAERAVVTQDILATVDAKQYPDIIKALQQYADNVYSLHGEWTQSDFVDMQHDMYAANPMMYTIAMKDLWKVALRK